MQPVEMFERYIITSQSVLKIAGGYETIYITIEFRNRKRKNKQHLNLEWYRC